LPFSIELIQWLADHRTALLTSIFQFFSLLGDAPGYVLLIALIYFIWGKQLAVQLAVLALCTMAINHTLKMVIQNARPFISDGTYLHEWAVSPATAAALATEYSTPSGHAMASASFYGYLVGLWPTRGVRAALLGCVLMIGASRAYLGVHYVEDVLGGWLCGFALAYAALRYGARLEELWQRCGVRVQSAILLSASLALWGATRALNGQLAATPPPAFVSYAGLLTGVVAAYPVERRLIRVDPRSGGLRDKLLRYLLCVGLMLATLVGLRSAFPAAAFSAWPFGNLLRFLHFAGAGLVAVFVAPALSVRLGIAAAMAPERDERLRT
jgi:membrane-associated phospholipid phosphatase